jgi:hypothetical protein
MPGMPKHAPTSSVTLSGSPAASAAGTTVLSAAVPNGRYDCAPYTQTRWPAGRIHALADGLNQTGAIAVRHDPRERHR